MFLIIGASGFIGTYLMDELVKQNIDVIATGRNVAAKKFYERKQIKFVDLDISNEHDFERLPTKGVEGVVLLAGLLPANADKKYIKEYIDINVNGTINALEYCKKNNIKKFITTTSYADVQKNWEKGVALPADSPRNFYYSGDHAVYVISKCAAADLVQYYSAEYAINGSVFRLPPVYGVGPHSVIYANEKPYKSGLQVFIERAIAGKTIRIFGDADVRRDVVYIKDVVQAFIKALKSQNAIGIYNIASGIDVSLNDQVKDIIDVFSMKGNRSNIEYIESQQNNSISYKFDISKAKNDFDYDPEFIPFKKMMIDYKKELEINRFIFLSERNKI